MVKVYYDTDVSLEPLKKKTIAVIGYGSQGHAHALNLKDSKMNVVVGELENSKAWMVAEKSGLKVKTTV